MSLAHGGAHEGSNPGSPRIVTAALRQHEPFVYLADAVLQIAENLQERIVLHPSAKPADALRGSGPRRADLLVIDPASILSLGPAEVRSTPPVLVLSKEKEDQAKAKTPQEWELAFIGRDGLALRLARRIFRFFPSEFLDSLPVGLSSEQRLIIGGAIRDALRHVDDPHGGARASWRRRTLRRFQPVKIPAEVLVSAELWVALWRLRQTGIRSEMITATDPRLQEMCLCLTGLELAQVLHLGADAHLVRCLRERWGRSRTSPSTGERSDPEFLRLYDRFRRTVRQAARSAGATRDLADDAEQHVFMSVWAKGPEFWSRDHKATWFWRKTEWFVRHVLERRRRRHAKLSRLQGRSGGIGGRRASRAEMDKVSSQTMSEPVVAIPLDDLTRGRIRYFVERLPEPKRSVCRLCVVERWSVSSVAGLLDEDSEKIKSIQRRLKEKARRELGDLSPLLSPVRLSDSSPM